MPISEEKSVPKNIERLAHSHPEFPPKQRVAVAFAESRRANAHGGKKSAHRAKVLREAADNGEA
jgi:hypothetical protein